MAIVHNLQIRNKAIAIEDDGGNTIFPQMPNNPTSLLQFPQRVAQRIRKRMFGI